MSDLSIQSRELLDRARAAHDPSPAQRDRLRAALAVGVAAGAVAATATTASAATAASAAAGTSAGATAGGTLLTAKVLLATALAAGTVTGGAVAARHTTATAPLAAIERVAPRAQARSAATQRAQAPAPVVDVAPPPPVAPVVEPLPPLAPPRRTATGETPGAVPPLAPAADPAPPAEPASLAGDASLLQLAMRADRRADWDGVLAATARHADEFPDSTFAPERDALRAIALCRTGHRDDGRALVVSLGDRAGGAPDRARRACAAPVE